MITTQRSDSGVELKVLRSPRAMTEKASLSFLGATEGSAEWRLMEGQLLESPCADTTDVADMFITWQSILPISDAGWESVCWTNASMACAALE